MGADTSPAEASFGDRRTESEAEGEAPVPADDRAPMPFAPPTGIDPNTCLSGAKYLEDCRYVATARPTPIVRYYRSIADGKHVWSIDLNEVICPYFPICDAVVNGTVVKSDHQHITSDYSKQIADPINQALESNRVFG